MADTSHTPQPAELKSAIVALALETGVPVQAVEETFRAEFSKLDAAARVKKYLRLITHSRVRAILKAQSATR